MNRPLVIALLFTGAALAALNIYQFLDRQSLNEELSSLGIETDAETGNLRAPIVETYSGSKLSNRSDRRKAPGSHAEDPENPSPPSEGFNKIASQWAKMMESPAMKKQMLAQMEGQIGPALADLYAHLGLEGEDLTHFKGILAEKWLAQQQIGMKMMSAVGDPEKNAAIKEELKKASESTEENVREFLNDEEDYAFFQAYQKQLPDRMELDQFSSALSTEGLTLSDEQKNQLLVAMGEERAASELGDVTDPQGWDFDNFNDGTIVDVMARMSDFHQRVQVRSGPILDDTQREVLATTQEQQRTMQEMGMKMGLEFMRNASRDE